MASKKNDQPIVPATGIWTVAGLADYLGMQPSILQDKLTDKGVKVLTFSNRYHQKLIRLEDLKAL